MGCCGEGWGCPLGWMRLLLLTCQDILFLSPSASVLFLDASKHLHLKSHHELNWLLEKAIEAKEETDRKHHLEASVPPLLGDPISGLDGVEVKDVHLGSDFLDTNPTDQWNGRGKIIHILRL